MKTMGDILREPHKNDGGAAFPFNIAPSAQATVYGMSLRDWFAGQALAGMCANNAWAWASTASAAYEAADAMLAERSKSRS